MSRALLRALAYLADERPGSSRRGPARNDRTAHDEASRWLLDLGHHMAVSITAEIPSFSGGEEAFQTLRMGTESSTLRSMLLLVSNDPGRIGVTEEALEGDRDFVRRGISLDQVLRGHPAGPLPDGPRPARCSRYRSPRTDACAGDEADLGTAVRVHPGLHRQHGHRVPHRA